MANLPSDPDLDGQRARQQAAHAALEAVARELRPGMAEAEATAILKARLGDAARPFAWFGPRTAGRRPRGLALVRALTGRRLADGAAFILGDRGTAVLSGALGTNPIAAQLQDDLAAHRDLILAEIRNGASPANVARAVDRLCRRQGFEARHRSRGAAPLLRRPGESGRALSEAAPPPGLWLVTPHIAFGDVGAAFSELLIVDGTASRWLDDDLPHVRRATTARAA